MKAIIAHGYGNSSVLRYEEAAIPEINDGQILVKVYATSVNHFEIKRVSGALKDQMPLTFPWIPGYDFAGVVEKCDSNVTGFKTGDKVYGNCKGGSYAEYLAVDITTVGLKPDNLTFAEACSVPMVAETAWQAINTHGELREGQKVLIHGGAGAVGAYAVQFAKRIGAVIYATASARDRDYLLSLGADITIDYQTEDFTSIAGDMDLVIVLVPGDIQQRSYSVLKQGGRLVTTVGPVLEEMAKERNVTAISMSMKPVAEELKNITNMIEAGRLSVDVEIILPLEEAAYGWQILSGEDPGTPKISHGKIVLEVVKEND